MGSLSIYLVEKVRDQTHGEAHGASMEEWRVGIGFTLLC